MADPMNSAVHARTGHFISEVRDGEPRRFLAPTPSGHGSAAVTPRIGHQAIEPVKPFECFLSDVTVS
jgi:hypothetical protein